MWTDVMNLVDSHVHLWDPVGLQYPWLANEPALQRSFGPADLAAEARGVTGVVVVEGGCRGEHALAEVDWVQSLTARWPVIRGMVAQVPLERGPEALAGLEPYVAAQRRFVVGVRRNVQDEPAGFMNGRGFVSGVNALAEHDLPFDACIRQHQLRELTELVDQTSTTVVLDHLGKPDLITHGHSTSPHDDHAWFADLADLARRPNVVAKISGLTTEADHAHWREGDLAPYVAHAIDVFGPDRCLFGSDWPVATLATTYERWRHFVESALDHLPSAGRTAILSGNAERVYRLT
jgi:L-fuconolactonase